MIRLQVPQRTLRRPRTTSGLRLDQAAAALLSGERSILEIAIDSGFASHELFTGAFLRRFNMTPAAYRARGGAGRRSATPPRA